jgi:hypothetical protein
MAAITILLMIITAVLICVSGYLLTVRIYPRLYTSTDVAGEDNIEVLQQIAIRISNIEMSDSALFRIKSETAEAISVISNSFIDNKTAIKDSTDRAKTGMILLIIATLIQTFLAILQIIERISATAV